MGGATNKHAFMGWWGNLGSPTQKGIISYSLSPFAQRPFAGAFHAAVFNTLRRTRSQILYWGIPFIGAYSLIAWAKEKNKFYNSKAGHHLLEEH